jgi:hypothetical protein
MAWGLSPRPRVTRGTGLVRGANLAPMGYRPKVWKSGDSSPRYSTKNSPGFRAQP